MKRSILFTLIYFLIAISNAKAQKDFIVTVKGDTVYGEIKARIISFNKNVRFKEANSADVISIKPDSLTAYFKSKDEEHYVRKKLPNSEKYEFLERLENGKAQLFERIVSSPSTMGAGGVMFGGNSTKTWYANLDNGELLEIKTSGLIGSREQREKNFDSIIASYPELLTDFKAEKNFSFDMLRSYIKKYNYYYKNLPKTK